MEQERRIFVTAISGDIANGILKILREEGEKNVFGCDVYSCAVGMDKVGKFYQCKYAYEEGYIDELLENCLQNSVTHLIVTNEREIEKVSRNISLFSNNGIKVLINKKNILETCLDKYKTMIFLQAAGITIPKTYSIYGEAEISKTGRFLLKPRKSNGAKGIREISIEEFADFSNNDKYILQEYIDGEEYTVGVFKAYNDIRTIIFKRLLYAGYSYQVELIYDKHIDAIAKKIATLLSVQGAINIQLKKKENVYYVFEINPRISGTVRFRHLLGFKDLIWWLEIVDGNILHSYLPKYQKALGFKELNEKYVYIN